MEEMLKKAKTLNMSSVKQVILQELYLTRNPIIAAQMLDLCNMREETYGWNLRIPSYGLLEVSPALAQAETTGKQTLWFGFFSKQS